MKNQGSCVRCGVEIQGSYCSNCGEKQLKEGDKDLVHFFEEIFSSVFVADGKFFQTIKLLLFKPGELTKNFILGIRRKYLSPLQLFFFANLVYFIFPVISTFNTSLDVQLYQLPYSSMISPVVDSYLELTGRSIANFSLDFDKTSTSNGKLLLILLVFFQGFYLKLLFLKKNNFYMIDFFAGSAYFYGFYTLFVLVIFPTFFYLFFNFIGIPIASYTNELNMSIIFLVIAMSYMYLVLRRAYGTSKYGAIWRSIVLGIFIIPSFVMYRFVLFWVTFWMTT